MLTIISFILTLLGSINWLMIGLLQYDFIAGIFGFQASIFSRIIYIVFGLASIILVFKTIKGKGTLSVFSRRNKQDLSKNLAKIGKMEDKQESSRMATNSNIESSEDLFRHNNIPQSNRSSAYEQSRPHSSPQSLFDEHFEDGEPR